MKHFWAISLLAAWAQAFSLQAADISSPKAPVIDKPKLESYLRYAEGFAPDVKFVVDDPVATPLAGYYRLLVHLSLGDSKQEKTYYLTADGKHILPGPIWDLDQSPFVESSEKLTADGPAFGPTDARITIVVFSDFQCPYCREFARTIRDNIPQKYPRDVRVVFKDFPLDAIHPWARAAAEAGHCVGDSKPEIFWDYHDWIYQNQGEITAANLRAKVLDFSRQHHLDDAKITTCLDTQATLPEVAANEQEARVLDLQKTPTFFLNGRMVAGSVSWNSLNTLIQMELNRSAGIPQAAVRR